MADKKNSTHNDQFNNISKPIIANLKKSELTDDTTFSFDKLGPFIKRKESEKTVFLPVSCFRIYNDDVHTPEESEDSNTSKVFYLNRDSNIYEPILFDDQFVFVKPKNQNSNADFLHAVNQGNLVKSNSDDMAIISNDVIDSDLQGFINNTVHSQNAIIPIKTEEYTFSELFLKDDIPDFQSGFEDTPPEI